MKEQQTKKTKRWNKNKKGKKPMSKPDKEEYTDYSKKGSNDISWYGDPKLLEAVGRHNFTNPLGKQIGYETYNPNSNVTVNFNTNAVSTMSAVPGVMSFDVLPSIGFCENATDAGNIFTRNFYSFIRHANAGHANYDAPDMGLYVLAIDDIHMQLENLVRIYGVARTFSSMNRYLPNIMIRCMGVNPVAENQDLSMNLADIRAKIIQLMVKVGTLTVPKDIKYLERHRELMKWIYSDGDTAKAQVYLFRPAGYRIYTETSTPKGGKLEFRPFNHVDPMGIYDYLGIVSSQIDAVMASEDMNIMSGDILKAYGVDGVYKMEYFDENYTVIPTYNPEMLLEIHNLRAVGDPFDNSSMDIYQDPDLNIIKFTPKFKGDVISGCVSSVINMPVEVPTPEQVVIATRLNVMGSVGQEEDNTYTFIPESTGSEIITKMQLSTFRYTSTGLTIFSIRMTTEMDENFLTQPGLASRLARIDAFNWHPMIYLMNKHGSPTVLDFEGCFGEFDNYTTFNRGDLRKLHEMCLVGQFNVPLMGTWSTASAR